jgi:hypothetical protein
VVSLHTTQVLEQEDAQRYIMHSSRRHWKQGFKFGTWTRTSKVSLAAKFQDLWKAKLSSCLSFWTLVVVLTYGTL